MLNRDIFMAYKFDEPRSKRLLLVAAARCAVINVPSHCQVSVMCGDREHSIHLMFKASSAERPVSLWFPLLDISIPAVSLSIHYYF